MAGRKPDLIRRRVRQDAFLAAYQETGVIVQAAERSGIVATQHHAWLKSDPEYAVRFAVLKETTPKPTRKPHPRGYRIGGLRGEQRSANQEKFLEAYSQSGIAADAAQLSGVPLMTYHTWVQNDPEFAARAAEVATATEAQRRETMSARWSSAATQTWSDEGRRERQRQRQREVWTPEKRAEQGRLTAERVATPEETARRSAETKGRWQEPGYRENFSRKMQERWATPEHKALMAERMNSPEVRSRLSQASREYWASLTPEERKERTKKMRRAFKGGHMITGIEAKVIEHLNEHDVFYQTHGRVGTFEADIVTSDGLIIECDGAWFHEPGNERDAKRDANLTALGYKVLRLTEAEITAGDFTRLDEIITK
jgi:very-short-patch-repair endonuclease